VGYVSEPTEANADDFFKRLQQRVIERVAAQGSDDEEHLQRQIAIASVEEVMADAEGDWIEHVERLSRGRIRITFNDGEVSGVISIEQLARHLFPRSFPLRTYQRWEDAMVAQARLHEFVVSHAGRRYMDLFQDLMNENHPPRARLPDGFLHSIQAQILHDAEPVWVSGEMCDLIDEARHSFKPEPPQGNDPFVPTGFALFPRGIEMHDSAPPPVGQDHADEIKTRAISWTSIHSEDLSQGVFWVTLYNAVEDHPDRFPEPSAATQGPLVIGHMFQQTWGQDPLSGALAVRVEGEQEQDTRFRAAEQAQIIQTLWRLGSQFVPVKRQAPRGIRKDAKRKLRREMSDVNLVVLRREYGGREDAEPTGRHYSVTFLVNGYWATRHTREGPRQVWVKPHLKGEGPFKETQRAWEFRR
jgi:hypothetical protein